MRPTIPLILFGWVLTGAAGLLHAAEPTSPAAFLAAFTAEAQQHDGSFRPDAVRGAQFYRNRFAHNEKMPSCSSCHTPDPTQTGKHVVTGKTIAPLSPKANPERFTDAAKVNKWLTRNCKEVVGRECTALEKADLLAFLLNP